MVATADVTIQSQGTRSLVAPAKRGCTVTTSAGPEPEMEEAEGVEAEGHVPMGAVSRAQDPGLGVKLGSLLGGQAPNGSKIKVMMVDGFLAPLTQLPIKHRWVTFVWPSSNILEQNCELCTNEVAGPVIQENLLRTRTFLRITRSLRHGEELKFWFSAPLAAIMVIPVLPLTCIQSPDRYVCSECGAMFCQPNPLKVHIMLACVHQNYSIRSTVTTISNEQPRIGITRSNQTSAFRRITGSEKLWNIMEFTQAQKVPRYSNDSTLSTKSAENVTPTGPSEEIQGNPKHTELPECPQQKQLPDPVLKSHACQYCGKVYSRRYGLKIHIRTHTGYKPLQCKFCFRSFSDPSNLNKHIRLHSELNTPYKCSLCGKVLVRRRDLERHLRARHPSGIVSIDVKR